MDLSAIDFGTLDPRSQLSKSVGHEVVDGKSSSTSIVNGLIDSDITTSGDSAFRITNPAWAESVPTDLSRLQIVNVDANSMTFDVTNSGSTEFGNFNFSENSGTPIHSGISTLDEMGVYAFENQATHGLATSPYTIHPVMMPIQSINLDRTAFDLPDDDNTDISMTNYNTTGFCNPNLGRGETDRLRGPQTQSSNREWQTSTTGLCDGTRNGGYHLQHSQTPFPHPTPPKETSLRGIPTSRNEYQPQSLGVMIAKAKISADDWEDLRPFIEQLYLVENVKLKELMQIMEIRFGFVATKKMYKTKINQWGLEKNYKAAEKEHLARIVKSYRDSGRGIPPLTLRNRAVKMNRVRRFCKKQRFLEEICDALPAESCSKGTTLPLEAPAMHRPFATGVLASTLQVAENSSVSPMLGSKKISFDLERPFSTASRDGRIELILFQTKIYHQSLFDCTKGLNVLNSAAMLDDSAGFVGSWRDKLAYGAQLTRGQKPTRGWQMIDEACHAAKQVLEQPHQHFFGILLYLLGSSTFPDLLRTNLLRFFTKLSAAILGCNHPISVCFYHLQEQEIIADVTITAFKVLMDIAKERSDPSNDDVWNLKLSYCDLLKERCEYTTAQSYVLQFLKQSEDVFGRVHWHPRSFLFELARIHYGQRLHELAEREYQDVLQQGRQGLGDRFPDYYCIVTLYELAKICGRQEDFTQSEEYWRQSLAGAIKEWGVGHEVTIFLLLELERSFKLQQRDAEAWLQQNFGISCV